MENIFILNKNQKTNTFKSLKEIFALIKHQKIKMVFGILCVFITSSVTIITPYLLGLATDEFILKGLQSELLLISLSLVILYLISSISNYLQIIILGNIGVQTLYELRNNLFKKLNELPIKFFNVNKSGDLISRINNDTDVLNSLFSEVLVRFISSFFTILGIGIFLLILNVKLGLIAVSLVFILIVYTILTSKFYRKINKTAQDSIGSLSAEVSEGINNFNVIVAYDKKDFFRSKIEESIKQNFKSLVSSSIVNSIANPIYDFVGNLALIFVLVTGLVMINNSEITVGNLITFLLLVNRFYEPLRILASLIGNIQKAAASWERVNEILSIQPQMSVVKKETYEIKNSKNSFIEIIDLDFGYDENLVIKDVNLSIEKGKTYALVGPTGGGKSTLASLIMRLYDPVQGKIIFKGYDLRSFEPAEISNSIGFILQDPFLIQGTIADNLKYGNQKLSNINNDDLLKEIDKRGLSAILQKFSDGLETDTSDKNKLSLGQKQLIAFLRAVLRDPEILIMDEATANVDTMTEKLLEKILDSLPNNTSKIIIAHRLNTIRKADEIYLIANGRVTKADRIDSIFINLNNKV